MPIFLFDENISWAIAQVLLQVEYSVRHVGNVPELGSGAHDADIIGWCSENHAVWVTADFKAKRINKYAPLIKQTGISVAWFRYPSKTPWNAKKWLRVIVNKIDILERDFSESRPRWLSYGAKGEKALLIQLPITKDSYGPCSRTRGLNCLMT